MTAPFRRPSDSEWIRAYAQVQVAADTEIVAILRDAQTSIAQDMARIVGSGTISDQLRYEQMARTRQAILVEQGEALRRMGKVVEARRLEAAARAIELGDAMDIYVLDRLGQTQSARDLLRSLGTGLRRTSQVALARTEFSFTALSQRIYNTDVWLGSRIDRRITSLLAQGKTAREFAAEAQDWFNPQTPGGVRFAAMRLARSEINNAFHAVSVQQAQDKPWVTGMRWHLSGSHPKPDICDEYAHDDRYDLGPGVFPKKDVPRKPHPQCFCYVTPEQIDEDEFLDQLVSGRFDEYIEDRRSRIQSAEPPPKRKLPSEPGRETLEDARAYVAGLPADVRKSLKQGLDQGRKDGTLHPFDLQIHHALGGRKPTAAEISRATEFRRAALARKAAMDAEAAARRAAKATAKTAPPKVPTPATPKAQPVPKPAKAAKAAKATAPGGPTRIDVGGSRIAVSNLTDDMAQRVAGRLEHQHELVPTAVGQLRRVKGSPRRIKVYGDTRGARGTYEDHTRTITLHHDTFDERHLTLPSFRPGWTGRHRDAAEAVLDHEFGHHLHHLVKGTGREQEVWDVISDSMGLPAVDSRDFIGLTDWMAAHRSTLRSQVSAYGSTAPTELMAEIWAEYSGGEVARPHIKKIGDRIRRILESS